MTDPLRVLLVTGGFPLASETFVREQAVELLERGVDLDILALRPGDGTWDHRDRRLDVAGRTRTASIDRPLVSRLALAPIRAVGLARHPRLVARLLSPRLGWRAISGQLLEIAAALGGPRRYDAIHCEFGPMGRIALPLIDAGLLAGPLSVAFYGYDITREIQKHGGSVYEALFARASILLPNSEYLAGLLRDAGAPPEKVRLHRLGIRTEDFVSVDRSGREGPLQVLAVGRFVEKKGFEYLIRAVAHAGNRLVARVRLIGDGPLRGDLERLARDLGVEDRVAFDGWRSNLEVGEAMRNADLFLAPSVTAADGDMEGMPLVIAEALASGLPVVGTRHSGIPEAVVDGENGSLVEERDVAGLAEAIVRYTDSGIRTRHGSRSLEIVNDRFSSRLQGDALLAVLREISGPGRIRPT